MDAVAAFISSLSPWAWIVVAALAAIAVAMAIAEILARARFRRIIKTYVPKSGARPDVGAFTLKAHARWLERLAKKKGIEIMEIFDFREAWLERFRVGKTRKDFNRLLDFYPDYALYPCFLVALDHAGRAADFRRRLDAIAAGSGESDAFFLLKRLAFSCGGRDFDGVAAWRLLGDRVSSFREMTGDPEWQVRFFAAKILLRDDDPVSSRILWDFLSDPGSAVRVEVASEFRPRSASPKDLATKRVGNAEEAPPAGENPRVDGSAATGESEASGGVLTNGDLRAKLFAVLMGLYLRDPVLAVRVAAKARLLSEFPDLYRVDSNSLSDEETLHALELLDPVSKEDENFAFACLDSADLERRLAAARFLQKAGSFERALIQADFGDRETLERTRDRLERAASVNVAAFLGAAERSDNPAALYLAACVLAKTGDRRLVAKIADRAFRLVGNDPPAPEIAELYAATLRCVGARGNEDAARELLSELERRRRSPGFLAALLPALPAGFDYLFAPPLFSFLEDAAFEPKDALRAAVRGLARDVALPEILDIVKDQGRPSPVRIEALKILGELELPYVIQYVLEALPLLPRAELSEFARRAGALDEKRFNARAGSLLASADAAVRAAVIRALPETGKREYIKEIREALGDADPDVRVAALASLAEMDEGKVLNTNAIGLLRDPVERVREGAASALASVGGEATIQALGAMSTDPNEVDSVRAAAAAGLGASPSPASVDALVDALEKDDVPPDAAIAALSRKSDRRCALRLVERFKDATPAARARIASAFGAMGEPGESQLVSLLKEDIASLKPHICEALEASGYVDARIKRLNHRLPAERKAAAADLSMIATAKAFKGIVQAARDPDPEIRVLVTRALEFLNTPEGAPILVNLEEDPDKRVRKFTAWAIERVRAKTTP